MCHGSADAFQSIPVDQLDDDTTAVTDRREPSCRGWPWSRRNHPPPDQILCPSPNPRRLPSRGGPAVVVGACVQIEHVRDDAPASHHWAYVVGSSTFLSPTSASNRTWRARRCSTAGSGVVPPVDTFGELPILGILVGVGQQQCRPPGSRSPAGRQLAARYCWYGPSSGSVRAAGRRIADGGARCGRRGRRRVESVPPSPARTDQRVRVPVAAACGDCGWSRPGRRPDADENLDAGQAAAISSVDGRPPLPNQLKKPCFSSAPPHRIRPLLGRRWSCLAAGPGGNPRCLMFDALFLPT
jgi:hypothetical protein